MGSRSIAVELACLLVIGLKVRRNQPQGSNCGLKVRSSNKPSSLYCSGSGRYKAMNGNLECIFSTEKYAVIRKRGRQVEVVSKFHPKFFGLKVRRNGPPPSIYVRSFSPITTRACRHHLSEALTHRDEKALRDPAQSGLPPVTRARDSDAAPPRHSQADPQPVLSQTTRGA